MPFNWFDVFLALILLWSGLAGLRAGLARVVVGLVATIVGLVAGFWFYRIVAVKLAPWTKTPVIADVFGFLVIFLGVMLLGALVGMLLSRLLRWVGLSWFNHVLGALAGLLRGALVAAALLDLLIAYSPSPMPQFIERSRLAPYATELGAWLVDLAPRELKDAFTEQMENLRQLWRHEAPPRQDQVAVHRAYPC